ncbi:MAG: hypothetical protein MUF36_03835 [Bacteroidales bacterium]|jgi:hypothetical protein|nr:hypothetical protein [Bacteroidales bacterium]
MKKDEKYEKLLDQLKASKPLLSEPTDIEERIMNRIQQSPVKAKSEFNLFDYLFGWVYIGWMRSALVTVAVFLVGLFIYQQSLILRRIEKLEIQTIPAGNQFVRMNPAVPDDNIILDKLTRLRLKTGRVSFTGKQVKELLDSYNEMEHRYKDLLRIIEDDPELKKILEEKLTEANKKKFNL